MSIAASKTRLAIGGGADSIAARLKVVLQPSQQRGIIFNNEYFVIRDLAILLI